MKRHHKRVFTSEHKNDVGEFEFRIIHKNGSMVNIYHVCRPIYDESEKYQGRRVSNRDITERKQMEEALADNEKKYRSFFENSMDAILLTVPDGRILSANQAACNMFDYSEDELIKMGRSAIIDVTDPKLSALLKKRELNGKVRGELTFIRKDGTRFPAEISSAIFKSYKGEIRTSMIIRDIIERKRTEESLRETRDYLENLLSFANAPIMVWDSDLKITRFNVAFERLTDYTMYDVLGKHPKMLFFDDKREEMSTLISRTSDGENLMSVELPVRCKDGSTRIVLWNTANIYTKDTKTIIATIAHGQDITERKRVEEVLTYERNLLTSLMENIPDQIYFKDIDSNFIRISRSLAENFGGSDPLQFIGKNDSDFFTEEYARPSFVNELEIMRTGRPLINLEEKKLWPDSRVTWSSTTKVALRDKIGQIIGTFGISRDITEHKLLEEQMRQMQKLEGLGNLAGGIAHDFNNILGIILAYITSIKRFITDRKKLDLAIDTIRTAVDRGKTLVQQILTFARKTEIAFGAVNVNDVVMEIMTMIMETFPKILNYSQNFDKAVPYINADRSQLHQALLNLCINARDAMPKGGMLTINTRMVSVASLRSLHPDAAESSYVCLEVSDTGEGMSEETQKRIFEPFFTTKEIGKGTGLGLSVVFGIVQTHKGFIDVESEIGKGTTFRLYLPASKVAEQINVKVEERLEDIPGGTETLLVVEDEEMLMLTLRMSLVDKGYKVISASDGFTALNIYQEKKNDIAVVLTDLGLPNISGLEVCQQIKKINPKERIIMATGYLAPEIKLELLKVGIHHFLFKPYDLTKVLKEVREVLDEK